MDGKLLSRAADIAIFASGNIKPKFIYHGPLDITVYGNTAIVKGVDISAAPPSAIIVKCISASQTC